MADWEEKGCENEQNDKKKNDNKRRLLLARVIVMEREGAFISKKYVIGLLPEPAKTNRVYSKRESAHPA